MDHTRIDRWHIKPGRETEFEDAWSEAIRQLRGQGGLGGELFRSAEGEFVSISRWPSADTREACFADMSWLQGDWAEVMADCSQEHVGEMPLELIRNLRSNEKPFYTLPTLTTERLTLRPLVLDDAEAVAPALMDEDNMRYWSRGPLESVAAVREYMKWNVDPSGIACFAITESSNTQDALGWVILMDRGPKQVELGYILRPDAQGRGLAREAVSRVLEYGFGERGLRRISADIDPDNKPSIKAMEALGFQYEGLLRGVWETHLGVRDSVYYARLSTD